MSLHKNIVSIIAAVLPFFLLALFVYTQTSAAKGAYCAIDESTIHITPQE